jgi:hypothetical protein
VSRRASLESSARPDIKPHPATLHALIGLAITQPGGNSCGWQFHLVSKTA